MNQPQTPNAYVRGIIKTITHFNEENGFFIVKVSVGANEEKTVVGNAPAVHVGEQISAKGVWASSNWGPQLKASHVDLTPPTMTEGIEKYLASSVPGIGKAFAKKLVAALGEAVFEVIENTPEKLKDIPGVGAKRAQSLVDAYQEQRAIREIMVFLHSSGLSAARAKRVFEHYGEDAVSIIKQNPYVLCQDIWGVGFSTADAVARKNGIEATSEFRVRAGILHVLLEASGQGSCGLPIAMARESAAELLGVEYPLIDRCIEQELLAEGLIKDVSAGQECLFLPIIYAQERAIAEKLVKLSRRSPAITVHNIEDALIAAQVDLGIELEAVQAEAVRVALSSNVCVITGGPGTGKTTITRVLLHILEDEGMSEILLCAPTGKAAKRASEATGRQATTVHRMLEVGKDGRFKFNKDNPLDAHAVTVDEASMLDVSLMYSTVNAISVSTRLIIIGDVNQLPSVGAGKVLADMIDSRIIPCVRLTQIFRQAANSDIIKNAHAVNNGLIPEIGYRQGSDFYFNDISPRDFKNEAEKRQARADIEAELLRVVRDMYKLGYDPIKDVQVLAPMRKGPLGVESLNLRLQKVLNPNPSAKLEAWGTVWGVGDKVMQTRNNYDKKVFNGDIGYVVSVDTTNKQIEVEFDGGLVVPYKGADYTDLTLAYVYTIHKSQGSEAPVVVMPLEWGHYTMLRRNLLYTGMTRAKKLMIILGQKAAARRAVETSQVEERYSRLCEWLKHFHGIAIQGA